MSRNTGESPMDFEWGNGTGAIDGRSPFAQVSSNAQRFPQSASKKSEQYAGGTGFASGRTLMGGQGTHSAYDSPSKLRTMGSSPSKPLPPTPAFNTLFNTPRKPRPEVDDSSAGETPRSPERGNDSDATPDIVNNRSALTMFDNASAPAIAGAEQGRRSPTKERPQPDRRDSMIWRLVAKTKNTFHSPGRGELPRSEHTGAIEKKRAKKRKRDVDRRVARRRRHSMSDSGDEQDQPPKSPRKRSGHNPPPEKEPHWISNLFTFIGQHPSVPHILSYYAQFMFNVFLLGCCGYLIYCFWSAVQGDVDKKSYEAIADVLADMARCANDYEKNNCAPATRMPALEVMCQAWDKCMKRDPNKIGRARVSAHTFAEIFNSFVEPISWKAMAFTTILVFGCFGISNMAFGFFRNKAQQFQPPNYGYGYGYNGPPPPTPQRTFSGQDGQFYPGTPWHMPPPGLGFEPQPSGGYGQIEGGGSPVRRLVYNQ